MQNLFNYLCNNMTKIITVITLFQDTQNHSFQFSEAAYILPGSVLPVTVIEVPFR